MMLLIVNFQSVLVEYILFADKVFNMFPVGVDHIWEMLSVLINLDDTLGGMVVCWIGASKIFV